MIRPAKFADIPEVVRLAHELVEMSRYGDVAVLDVAETKKVAMSCISQQTDTPGSGMTLVSDTGEGLNGMFVGIVRPFYEVCDIYMASNLIWHVSPGADARIAARLLKAFEKWASKADRKVIFRVGLSDAITDPVRAGKILQRCGLRLSGAVYEKEI